MKQMLPFLIIIALIGGVVFWMQDDYEGPFQPDHEDASETEDWEAVFYIDEADSGETMMGLRLEAGENVTVEEVQSIEFFVDSAVKGFFYQNLELDDFDGTIDYSEPCPACENTSSVSGRALLNWDDGETHSSQLQFRIETE
ncbi:hypothetical protein [Alkalicoccus chagannorensis]|uniref:hypothetical protein n=1 Tax=Alkalicoccus chagannorensis TaxID=427072 RepID=UPI0003FC8F02|nr:hypothetical protein [Alkalicoccus chagannorensis]